MHEIQIKKDDKGRLHLSFGFNREFIEKIKTIPGRKYHSETKQWSISNDPDKVEILKQLFDQETLKWPIEQGMQTGVIKNISSINNHQKNAIYCLCQTIELKGYSKSTLRTYTNLFKRFLCFYPKADPALLTEEEIRNYLYYLVHVKKVSRAYQNQSINAIKFYYEKVLGQERKVYYLERSKKEKRLPVVLSQNEVKQIFLNIRNFKHRIALMLIYSAGLRRSELINLKVGDIDFERNQIWVRGGKGLKDRISLLSESLKPDLLSYMKIYKPKMYFIEGRDGFQYSVGSLRNILIEALKKTDIRKKVTLHTLRHSFATHMLEAGTATRYIQDLLGHSSPKTTEIYTHITNKGRENLRSPLDDWE